VSAAPVRLSRARLATGASRAVLVNSGQANAATGAAGDADALRSTAVASAALGLEADELFPCSTGVIGEPLHLDLFEAAVPTLVASLGRDGGDAFAHSIMTTDTVDKQAYADAPDEGFRVGGCAKGVGMIAPDLATMLAFVTVDAVVSARDLHRMAQEQLGARSCFYRVGPSERGGRTGRGVAGSPARGRRRGREPRCHRRDHRGGSRPRRACHRESGRELPAG